MEAPFDGLLINLIVASFKQKKPVAIPLPKAQEMVITVCLYLAPVLLLRTTVPPPFSSRLRCLQNLQPSCTIMTYPVIRLAIGHALHLLVVSTCKQYIYLMGRFSVQYLGIFLHDFYESCRILASLKGESKYKKQVLHTKPSIKRLPLLFNQRCFKNRTQ